MIKLLEILSELKINNPNVTVKEVLAYFYDELDGNEGDEFWTKYSNLKQKYASSDYSIPKTSELISNLSQPDLNKFYKEMKQLVQKYK